MIYSDLSYVYGKTANLSSFMLNQMCVHVLSCVQLFATLWTVAPQAPLSIEFFRQEYQSGLPFLTPGDSSQPRDQIHVS